MPATNNVTRLLDARKIPYTAYDLPAEKLGATETARLLDVEPASVFKSIVVTRDMPTSSPKGKNRYWSLSPVHQTWI